MSSRVHSPDLLTLYKPEVAGHFVQFYENDLTVVESVSYLAAKTLAAGNSTVLVGSAEHLAAIKRRLNALGVDLEALGAGGRYVACDASETLERICVDAHPDESRFRETIGTIFRDAVERSADGFVFAFGEMVALLCASGKPRAAIRLERLWNALARESRFSLFCAYPIGVFDRADPKYALEICAEHGLAIPAEVRV